MKESRLAPSPCPYCGYVMDATTSLESDAIPNPGDFSLCLKCGGITVFTESLAFRKPEDIDFLGVSEATLRQIMTTQSGIRRFHARKN